MNVRQIVLLITISAIWGGSFIFMRVLSPVYGPVFTSSLRLLSASLFLYGYIRIRNETIEWKRHMKWFVIIGVLNSAIPFTLYGIAALYIPASISVILNSTSPMFGMLYGVWLIHEGITIQKMIGVVLGTIGVIVVTSGAYGSVEVMVYVSVVLCVLAASLYGLSGALMKKYTTNIPSKHLVLGSMFMGGLLLLPFGLFAPITGTITIGSMLLMMAFGVIGTAVAYLIYFTLIRELGPVKALMTTYLMPVFGIIWSILFLRESLSIHAVIGLVIILLGMYAISSKRQFL